MKSILIAFLLTLAGMQVTVLGLLLAGVGLLVPTPTHAAEPLAQRLARDTRGTLVTISDATGKVFCSGVWVGKHTVWTKVHCLAGENAGEVKFNDVGCVGDRMLVSDFLDNTIVSTCATAPKVAKFAPSEPVLGEQVFLWGHPLGEGPYWRVGRYMGKWVQEAFLPALQPLMFDFTAAGGDSGGPIFNSKGEVVCTAAFKRVEGRWPSYAPLGCTRPQFSKEFK